jgi:dTDP-4-amino-4,6-dideoxygalactose transaminase
MPSYPDQPLRVPFVDLTLQGRTLNLDVFRAFTEVTTHGRYVLGPEVEGFEIQLARYCGAAYAVGVGSGTDALLLALLALGLGPGDEVIVPSFTFAATVQPVVRAGAIPVFAEVDPATFCLTAAEVERRLSAHTRAVIPVHQYGYACDLAGIREVCAARGVVVIEDAAQAIGSTYNGLPIGADGGACACFSFFPSKNLGALGDGGAIVTNDPELAAQVRALRSHGSTERYRHDAIGVNSRLDTLQAAVLSAKLPYLDAWNAQRRANAWYYNARFVDLPGIRTPHVGDDWNGHLYTLRIADGRRDTLRRALAAAGIGTETYWPIPLHLQPCFRALGYGTGDLPVTERLCTEVLSLPVFPELTAEQREYVVEQVLAAVGASGAQPSS